MVQRAEQEEALAGMRVLLQPEEVGNPFAQEVREAGAFSEDYYGAFSIEKFAAASPLSETHEDAAGWLAYVERFKPRNFWYQDAGVGVWAYYEQYDNWQDTYGMDAVMAVYHSGHGSMDSNGVFYAAMGSNWSDQGTSAVSSKTALGNEQVRYAQTIDGIPVVAPGMGTLTVSIDNDLHVTSLMDRTRPVARLAERARMIPSLEGNGFTQGISAEALPAAEDLLQAAWQERMKEWILRGPLPRSFAVVPGSAEVGYAIRGNTAMLVARQEVEVDCGNNFLKRFKVEVPIQP
jgi:hypothetical protein